jgi:hypothetical protein
MKMRIALTTAFADENFEKPYFDHEKYLVPYPPIGLRLGFFFLYIYIYIYTFFIMVKHYKTVFYTV